MSDEHTDTATGDLTGRTFGQYELKQVIGQGGMATVYLGTQTSIGRTVAIKVLPSYFTHDPSFLQRFEREVKIISALQHPRVLPVYDYGQVDGQPYIVMAHMGGGTLADRIKQGAMKPAEALKLVEQIAEGLDHAHKKGIIHRDFKPSNVLLDEHGNAHLADFGIAKISESASQLTGSGVVGTPAYMAPEMAEKGDVTPAIDIYALGITLYQMLTGKYPYSGDTPIQVMMAHTTEPIPDVRQANPDLSEAISGVVRKAMAKNPADRYVSAGDLARDLRAAIEGRPIEAEPFTMGIDRIPTPAVSPTPVMPPPKPPASASVPARPAAGEFTPAGQPTPAYEMPAKKSRTGLWIGGIIGAVVLCGACLIGLFAFGGMAMISGLFATPTPTQPPLADVRLENATGQTICYLYISPNTSDVWGDDWLGSNVLSAGDAYTAEGLDPGLWDFRADDCEHNTLADMRAVTLDGGSNTVSITGGTSGGGGSGTGPVALTVINASGQTVCYLYISPSTESTWGDDWLASSVLADGESFTANIDSGSWDFRADDCDHNSILEEYGFDISGGSFTWEIRSSGSGGGSGSGGSGGSGLGGDASVTIVNNSNDTVCTLYFSLSSDTMWGTNWLSSNLAAGASVTFDNLDTGSWDFRADDCSNDTIREEYGVILNSGSNTWYVSGEDTGATLVIVNETSETICYVYIWPAGTSDRGDDQLGSATIPAGQEYRLTDIPPGRYNLRAETCSGSAAERSDVDISGVITWTINE